ncbi:MAG: undecaprenyl-phosphate glucose phosphotransferase [Pseudomonadota bacterium]
MASTNFSNLVFQSDITQGGRNTSESTARGALGPLPDIASLGDRSLISRAVIRGTARVCECLLLAALGFAIGYAYVPDQIMTLASPYVFALFATALATGLIFDALKLYSVGALSGMVRSLPALMLGWTTAIGILMATVFFLKLGPEVSRVWLGAWFVGGALLILSARAAFSVQVRRWIRTGRLEKRAVIYGAGQSAIDLRRALEQDADTSVRIVGTFDNADETGGTDGETTPGGLDELVALARRVRIDVVILNLPMTAETRLTSALAALYQLPVAIRMPASTSPIRFRPRTYSYYGSVPFIDLSDPPISDWGLVAKWLFDKSIAAAALVLLAPLMLAIAAAIKLGSKGPVLFRQKRYGFNNELIEIYKFRSMYQNRADANAAKLVTRDDPRVTPIGRFIRKTSIDELPQLFNVLKGDISLVGPRPHALQAKAADRLYDEVVEEYFARHKVKPGITGWAQINGWRGEVTDEMKIRNRVEHDLYYIENWSIFLDLYILMRTPFALLDTRSAY